jgi:hypothetical protein
MSSTTFLLINMALAFFNTGLIWVHEVDIFRHWKLMDLTSFNKVRAAHWKILPFFVFIPVGLAFVGSIVLFWYHPPKSPGWAIWGNFLCQILSHVLTGIFWGRWQAQLSPVLGPNDPRLDKIIKTHWVRTTLITIYALIFLIWTIIVCNG